MELTSTQQKLVMFQLRIQGYSVHLQYSKHFYFPQVKISILCFIFLLKESSRKSTKYNAKCVDLFIYIIGTGCTWLGCFYFCFCFVLFIFSKLRLALNSPCIVSWPGTHRALPITASRIFLLYCRIREIIYIGFLKQKLGHTKT